MTIYTAIFGPYEELKEPLVITPGWKYVCYTDQDFWKTYRGVWKIVPCSTEGDATKQARWIKIMGGPQGRANDFGVKTIWADASFTINTDLNKFWDKHFQSPMTVIPHPWRKNIGHEIEACIKNNRADIAGLQRQMKEYKELGITSYPVIASGILLRENTEEVRAFCDLWWSQIELSTRDQIGFAYAEYKMPGVAHRSKYGLDYRTDQEFIYKTHFNRR